MWIVSHKYDKDGARSPQFMPPGETLVLVTPARDAVWGWWRPHPRAGIPSMNGLNGWTCSIFRNTGVLLSSDLVLAAEVELVEAERRGDTAGPRGPDGLLTYVWPKKIRSSNPGYCFQIAGWTRHAWTDKGKRLLRKPIELAGIASCAWAPRIPLDEIFGGIPEAA